jgi:hypothetical protein
MSQSGSSLCCFLSFSSHPAPPHPFLVWPCLLAQAYSCVKLPQCTCDAEVTSGLPGTTPALRPFHTGKIHAAAWTTLWPYSIIGVRGFDVSNPYPLVPVSVTRAGFCNPCYTLSTPHLWPYLKCLRSSSHWLQYLWLFLDTSYTQFRYILSPETLLVYTSHLWIQYVLFSLPSYRLSRIVLVYH